MSQAHPKWLARVLSVILADPDVKPRISPEHETLIQVYKSGFFAIPQFHVVTLSDGLTRGAERETRLAVAILMALRGHELRELAIKDPQSATLRAAAIRARDVAPAVAALRRRLAPRWVVDKIAEHGRARP